MISGTAFGERIEGFEAVVGVVGLGYAGLPVADSFVRAGFRVVGYDIDPGKIESLRRRKAYLTHVGQEVFDALARSERFTATNSIEQLAACDAVIVCVPTPLGDHREPDLGYVLESARALGRVVRPGSLVVLESTTYPGTTRGPFRDALGETAGGSIAGSGSGVHIAYSPERIDPGRATPTASVPKLVGGLDQISTAMAVALYGAAYSEVVETPSVEVAEAAKLLENVFRAVNIALVNELKVILTSMGIDIWDVVRAAATKPFGFMPFSPGPGLGGHCIPIDPFYLSWKAREVGMQTQFIELAGEINTRMPHFVVERLVEALNRSHKPLSGSSILILGLAYKANIDDTREAPAFEIIRLLEARGAEVDYHDPHVPEARPVRRHPYERSSVALSADTIASYDAVVIVTDHDDVDYALVAAAASLIVDTRNVMAPYAEELGSALVKA